MLRKTTIAICVLFTSVAAFGQQNFSSQDVSVTSQQLQFGMDVTVAQGRVLVKSIQSGRPIAKKLRAGDLLFQYEVLDNSPGRMSITSLDDISEIKKLLEKGHSVELTIHRQAGSGPPLEVKTTLVADDLHAILKVETKTVRVPYTAYTDGPVGGGPRADGVFELRVYYGTNRSLENGQYTGLRDNQNLCRYGVCEVTIPPNHTTGNIERPRWMRFQFKEDPAKHIVLSSVAQVGRDGVLNSLRAQFENAETDRKRMMIFVHGYNTAFDDAARRAAQLTYDIRFPGLSAFFSWPSDGTVRSYPSDEADNAFSMPGLVDFLSTFDGSPDVDEIYVIAHSMGCRVTSRALIELKRKGGGGKIREVILAAPDIDAGVFQNQYAADLVQGYPRITVYASSRDKALWGSGQLHGSSRLGAIVNGRPTIEPMQKLDIIDASIVETSFMEHANFGDALTILNDIFHVVRSSTLRPNQRTSSIIPVAETVVPFYRYRP
ncbi:alpha/beta hydrolase [Crateriforma spongiae]|uniref:alpha/beta hydrolase n=1 Tax=Crateriforma spongiae TaxID=2724528 RepID=UPI0039AFFB23